MAIARLLLEKGYHVTVYIAEFGAKGTDDFQVNLYRLHQIAADIHFIQSTEFIPVIDKTDIVVDALYGSGLNRPLQSLSAEIVEHINPMPLVFLLMCPVVWQLIKALKGM